MFATSLKAQSDKVFPELNDVGKYKGGLKHGNWIEHYYSIYSHNFEIYRFKYYSDSASIYDSVCRCVKIKKEVGEYKNGIKNGTWKSYFANTNTSPINWNIEKEISYGDETKNGWEKIYANGFLKTMNYYKNGIMDSVQITYFDSSNQVKEIIPYSNNKINGLAKNYNINGHLILTTQFNNGKYHGKMISYYHNGLIWCSTNLVNDIQHGTMKYYDTLGYLNFERDYINGKPIETRFYVESVFETVTSRLIFNHEEQNKHIYFRSDSSVYITKSFLTDSTNIIEEFYPSGNIMKEVYLLNDKIHGSYKFYYESGQLLADMEFKYDKRWNVLGLYTAEGEPLETGTLKNGSGSLYRYDDNTKLRYIEFYRNGIEVERRSVD